MRTNLIAGVLALSVLFGAGFAGAAEPLFDVDVTLTNEFDKDFENLPVFFRIAQVFGRGVDFSQFARDGFHIYDEAGKELAFCYRVQPPEFSMANDELVLILPKVAKGATCSLKFTNSSVKNTKQLPYDPQTLVDNPNNLIPNGGFEKGQEGWAGGKIVTDVCKSGKQALLLEAPGRGGQARAKSSQTLAFKKDKPYYFAVWAKCENVVRHSYRWEDAGCRIMLTGGPLKNLGFLHTFQNPDPVTHFRVMDNRDWYCYKPEDSLGRVDANSQLTIHLNQFFKPFVDADKAARVWIDEVLLFEQPKIVPNYERAAKKLAPDGFFVYRRAATCTGSTGGAIELAKPYEKIAEITEVALKGERKLLTLGVSTSKPIANLSLSSTDLAGPKGKVFAQNEMEVEFNFAPAKDWKMSPTSLEGWCLDGNVPRSLDRPGCVDYFIGVRIPPDAEPGVYTGTIKVLGDAKELAVVPVKLKVEDAALAVITDRFMGEIYNNGCGPDGNTGAVLPQRDAKYYKYYSRTNFTMIMMYSHFLPFSGGGADVDMPKLLEQMKELRDVGGCTAGVGLYWDCSLDQQGRKGGPFGGSGLWSRCGRNAEAYRAAVKKLDDALAEAKLPRLVYTIWDEPRFYDQRLQVLKGTGAFTTADIFSDEMLNALNDKCFTHTSCDDPSYEPGPMLYSYVKKLGVRMGMAGWPSQHCTRYQTGMLYAVSDMNYWHHWYGNQFIGWHNHHKAFVRGSNSVGMGEGMIDLRYFETLKRAIEEAKAKGMAAKEIGEAEKYLQEIFAYCTGDWHWVGIYNGTAQQWGDDWFYDRWRGRMRDYILAIAGKKTAAVPPAPKKPAGRPLPW